MGGTNLCQREAEHLGTAAPAERVAREAPAGGESRQGRADLARLVARLEALAADPAKAEACGELLAKLRTYGGGPAGVARGAA